MENHQARLGKYYRKLCLVSAIILTCYSIHIYLLDDDLAEIHYKEYHENPEDLYPSITIYLRQWFIDSTSPMFQLINEKLQNFDSNLDSHIYEHFLSGRCSDVPGGCHHATRNKSWVDIDYDTITHNLQDFLNNFIIVLNNGELVSYGVSNNSLVLRNVEAANDYDHLRQLDYRVSLRGSEFKCFTFDIPYINSQTVSKIEITINADSFPENKIRPGANDYFISMSYPSQVIRSLDRNQVFLQSQVAPTSCYLQETMVGSVEVLRRRNKKSKPCTDVDIDHDKYFMENIGKKIGCIPQHWKVNVALKSCQSNQEYKAAEEEFKKIENSLPPCRSIEKLTQISFETDLGIRCTLLGKWRMMQTFHFHKETNYKEIKVVQAFGIQDLVGNAGK